MRRSCPLFGRRSEPIWIIPSIYLPQLRKSQKAKAFLPRDDIWGVLHGGCMDVRKLDIRDEGPFLPMALIHFVSETYPRITRSSWR